MGAERGQGLQVVTQHFGGNILHHRLLRQARDVLQIDCGGCAFLSDAGSSTDADDLKEIVESNKI